MQVYPHRRIVTASNRLYVHDSLFSASHHEPYIADFESTSSACFNSYTPSFITIASNKLKIWNCQTGIYIYIYIYVVSVIYV